MYEAVLNDNLINEVKEEFEEKKSWYPYFMNIAEEGEVLYG